MNGKLDFLSTFSVGFDFLRAFEMSNSLAANLYQKLVGEGGIVIPLTQITCSRHSLCTCHQRLIMHKQTTLYGSSYARHAPAQRCRRTEFDYILSSRSWLAWQACPNRCSVSTPSRCSARWCKMGSSLLRRATSAAKHKVVLSLPSRDISLQMAL